jgi:hypothetical protein
MRRRKILVGFPLYLGCEPPPEQNACVKTEEKVRRIKFRLGFIEVYQWRRPWPTGSAHATVHPEFVPMVFSSTYLVRRRPDARSYA